ncbi:hypothetical protein CLV80_10522 [Yoonia maritima]|uniref:Uncharacterized protein n=1 Tax=Yoonia maritima TaxID=1435347 RepID=A0A2T0VYY4_9RHOB|nr:hypothetical protein CLV80_10522 [Yoonia maritima]
MPAEGASRDAVNLSGPVTVGATRESAIGGEMPCLRLLFWVPGLPV